jgi:hypothetical protein
MGHFGGMSGWALVSPVRTAASWEVFWGGQAWVNGVVMCLDVSVRVY